jgi:D-lyxose ketol-isomerase
MITRAEYESAKRRAAALIDRSGVLVRPDEIERIEVADLGLGELEQTGLQILTMVNTREVGVKLLILFPGQCFAQHKHPPLGDYPGKEETFRCQYAQGQPAGPSRAHLHRLVGDCLVLRRADHLAT